MPPAGTSARPAQKRASAREVFLASLALPEPTQRAQFLDTACATDPNLRHEVETLLSEAAALGNFLEAPAFIDPKRPAPVPALERIGDMIGPYKLLQGIGEGGCGHVYMAEQEHPVRRRVALKVIKAGMDTKAVISRFEAERQALALMDHPNIARVLDAGTTSTGRPYFVMELVRGTRITDFCDEHGLGTRERLELFIKVCHAIQHAHQKGIIHRDIKPSNIMVTLHDGTPVPKVIDFGIAKAIDQRLTEKTVFTAFEQLIGTPAYMSPEQAEMSGLDLDTRSDIYSLGILLYELLTGQPPFDGKKLLESGLDAMRQTIRDEEPLRPSAQLERLKLSESLQLVERRHEKLVQVIKLVRGDLDWIVLKAVAKDRSRRFETANALAEDVRRYLDGELVTARPPSRAYRIERFVHRNRRWVGAGIAILAILMLATTLSLRLAVRATRAEREQGRLLKVAEVAQRKEFNQRQRAEQARWLALQRAYASDMNLVQQALRANNTGRAVELLNRHDPRPIAPDGGSDIQFEPDLRRWEWHYFRNQARSEAAFELPRQQRTVVSVEFSPDTRFLVSLDTSGTLKFWDMLRRAEVANLSTGGFPMPFAFSHQGRHLALVRVLGPRQTQIQLLATESREVVAETRLMAGIHAVTFSPEDSRLLLFTDDGSLRSWSLSDAAPELVWPAPEASGGRFWIANAVFSPDASRVAHSTSGEVRVLDVQTGQVLQHLSPFAQGVASLQFSPDSQLIAASPLFTEVETTIQLYSCKTGAQIAALAGHTSWIPDLAFSKDGSRLISAGADQTIRVWDLQSHKELFALRGHLSEVKCVAISPDGHTVVSGGKDGTLHGWDAVRSSGRAAFEILPGRISSLEFVPDGKQFLTLDPDGSVSLWNTKLLNRETELTELGQNVERVLLTPDGKTLFAGTSDGQLIALDWVSRRRMGSFDASGGRRSAVIPIGYIARQNRLITLGPGSDLRIWDTETWAVQDLGKSVRWPRPYRARAALSADGSMLAIPNSSEHITLLNPLTKAVRYRLETDNRGPAPMAFSPDGHWLAMASREGTVNLCDLGIGELVDRLHGHLLGVHDVEFSPDGSRLASASAKSEAVKLWDLSVRQEVATLSGEGSLFERVQFSPDGSLLVAINSNGKLHIWRGAPTHPEPISTSSAGE